MKFDSYFYGQLFFCKHCPIKVLTGKGGNMHGSLISLFMDGLVVAVAALAYKQSAMFPFEITSFDLL